MRAVISCPTLCGVAGHDRALLELAVYPDAVLPSPSPQDPIQPPDTVLQEGDPGTLIEGLSHLMLILSSLPLP